MSPGRFAQHLLILFFLMMSAAAFLYTMTRVRVSWLWPIVRYSYGMMAPYQDFNRENGELVAEEQAPDGMWHSIDLAPYFPYGFGETHIREYLLPFRFREDEGEPGLLQSAYRALAEKLLQLENARLIAPTNPLPHSGVTATTNLPHFSAVRLSWDEWPLSPDGFDALRREPFVRRHFIVEVSATHP